MKLAYPATRCFRVAVDKVGKFCIVISVALLTISLVGSQIASNVRTLSIAGRPEYANVLEIKGKAYIGIEDLAQLTHGSLSFDADRILLTLPGDSGQKPIATGGFSKDFLGAAIEHVSDLREWRITIVDSIQNNTPISEPWITELQRRAQKSLALTGTAKVTDDDQKCYPLIAAEYANMQKLSDRFLSMRRQLKYIDPRSLENDPLDRQILACAHSLASMAANNQFRDEGQCTEAR